MATKRKKRLPSLQKYSVGTLVSLFLLLIYWAVSALNPPRLPAAGEPAQLYANQIRDDLRSVFLSGMNEAQRSILLIIYTLTDDQIIKGLRAKADEGVDVWVIYDAKASPSTGRRLGSKVRTFKRISKGLMHQKIMVIDDKKVLIGSANMTGESLRLHGNLITVLDSAEMAAQVVAKARMISKQDDRDSLLHSDHWIGGQRVEFWFLPDDPLAVDRLKQLIRSAEKAVRVAMFTWTRNDLADEVIAAKNRGLQAEVVIDRHSGQGASAEIVQRLLLGGIPVRLSQGNGLLHHKFLYIDDKILVNGSANWTKAAFTKNDDCYIVLHELTKPQQECMERLWQVVSLDSSACPIAN